MKTVSVRLSAGVALALVLLCIGCSSSTDPFASYQPQINNATDNFQFQATGIQELTTTVEYPWLNTGTRAKVNQSCAITGGTAELVLLDSARVEVYRRNLTANGDSTSAVGIAGNWTVRVILNNLSGTLNFRAQKQ